MFFHSISLMYQWWAVHAHRLNLKIHEIWMELLWCATKYVPNFEDNTEESYFCALAVPIVEKNVKAGDKGFTPLLNMCLNYLRNGSERAEWAINFRILASENNKTSFCTSFTPFTSPDPTVMLVTFAGSRFHMEKTPVGKPKNSWATQRLKFIYLMNMWHSQRWFWLQSNKIEAQ